MNGATRLRQAWTITVLQLRRVFFARRSLWVYVLALFPASAFLIHGIEVVVTRERLSDQITASALLADVQEGDTVEAVLARLGEPFADRTLRAHHGCVLWLRGARGGSRRSSGRSGTSAVRGPRGGASGSSQRNRRSPVRRLSP